MSSRTYLLAGCTSGIGLETLKLLLGDGHRIIAAVRNAEPLRAFEGVEVVNFDAETEPLQLPLPEVLDGLVYFPGTINLKPFRGLTDADFRHDLEVNFLGAVRLLRAALPALQRSDAASVVLFSSVAAQTGMPFHASIAAAKGAVEGFARALAAELAPKVRANCIAPSLTDTPLAARFINTDSKRNASEQRHPLKRVGHAAETAQLVRLLLGDASGFLTGQVLHVDGGMSSLRIL